MTGRNVPPKILKSEQGGFSDALTIILRRDAAFLTMATHLRTYRRPYAKGEAAPLDFDPQTAITEVHRNGNRAVFVSGRMQVFIEDDTQAVAKRMAHDLAQLDMELAEHQG